ncbi:UDP-N-acetylmuramoyl-L-alanyl-D-glutamate--2,6-diaminopimelate ligase [Oribacterium sp. WCC10]|uniref:UDP-N-acetylmuramoyl-L-alanyl-D-glutamate--2, 6-diaminopimelate ligase n=1 Tax=Oribacterium sp. WCC10 TaxID=1855343 RepID=UPI0008DF3E10|nr:UDP-N-acetylmuramoyl-L-alanyl-D-glutamate--2,6-diaminopimelate ligase [Oribacterium sp. WCC10]SFG56506.1 UDP-N-acetylmuramoylalanyl-D-glutamate--2,6-diaminopimelate ligase [Oribacterium sp. WCC10]
MAKFSEWLTDLKYETVHGDPSSCEVNEVVFDSRKASCDTIFVCMKGSNVDSHQYIPDVISKGCISIVVEEEASSLPVDISEINDDITIIKVENAREALAKISAARFGYPSKELCVIAITGTKGKTTTAHMIQQVLTSAGKKAGCIGTTGVEYLGNHIPTKNTTPESYDLQHYFRDMVDAGCEYVVMEASSQAFKLHRVDAITFDYGIFTNIEPDHIGPNEHKDFEEYKFFKSCIFRQSKVGIINLDADYADELISEAPCKMYSFAINRTADFMAEHIAPVTHSDFVGTEFNVIGHTELSVLLNLPGKYNVYNAMAAISCLTLAGIKPEAILHALRRIHVDGRTEVVFKNDTMSVLVDYAHNEMAMENLLSTLREYQPKRLVVVFGCGGNRAKDRRYGMGKAAAEFADLSILTADNSRFEETEDIINDIKSTLVPAGGKFIEIPDRREAIEFAMTHAEAGDMIAVIGKGHEDYQEVKGVRTHFLDSEVIQETAKKYNL